MENRCVVCDEIIPEGRDVCWSCEHGYAPEQEKKKEENEDGEV